MLNYSETFKTYRELTQEELKGINEWLLQVNHDNMGIETVKLYHVCNETETEMTAYSYIEIYESDTITKIIGAKDFSEIEFYKRMPLGRFEFDEVTL